MRAGRIFVQARREPSGHGERFAVAAQLGKPPSQQQLAGAFGFAVEVRLLGAKIDEPAASGGLGAAGRQFKGCG